MKLTPVEIRKQEFKKSMRGYDPVEVDTFLELVANEYESLLQENVQLDKKVISAEAELKHFKEVEKTLKQTLYKVQETSQLSKENSQKEADLIIKEAELKSAQMVERARQDVHKMREEALSLRQQKESFISRLKHLLSSQMELLEVLSIDDVDRAKLKDKTKKVFSVEKQGAEKAAPAEAPLRKVHEKKGASINNVQKDKQETRQAKPAAADDNKEEKSSDFFKDVFGDNLDVDKILK